MFLAEVLYREGRFKALITTPSPSVDAKKRPP
jgi:hypothetical protein